MGKVYLDPKPLIHFKCGCGHMFEAEPGRTEDEPSRPWHPFRYFARCPNCEAEAEQVPWEVSQIKACSRATGPRTKEGIAKVTKNLAGHPTPEEMLITRFNGLKHGMRSSVATFWPARPGKYPQCETCEIRNSCRKNTACMKKTELYMKHHIAFETGDPTMLNGLRATLQANIQAVIDDMFLAIIQDGVRLKTPQWYYDKDGTFHWAAGADPETGEMTKLYEIQAHPLIKLVGDLIAKNGMTLSDASMTNRQAGDAPQAEQDNSAPTGDELREWKERSERQQQQLMKMIQRSQNVIDVTPVSTGKQSTHAKTGEPFPAPAEKP